MTSDYNIKASGEIAATAGSQVAGGSPTKPGTCYHGSYAKSDGTNTCVVTVYHGNAATAGTEIDYYSIPASTAAPQKNILNQPVSCPNGIFIVITGTGAKANVYYSLGD